MRTGQNRNPSICPVEIIIFIILIFASAFFSSSETAFLSFDRIRLSQFERKNDPGAKRVLALLSDPHRLLITILVGNTLVNIAASSVLAGIFYNIMGEKGVPVSIAVMTVIILMFGEVSPKLFALFHSEKVAIFASYPLRIFEFIFTPVRVVLNHIAYAVVRGVGIKVHSGHSKVTKKEIKYLVSLVKKKGVVKGKEEEMIESILDFKELNAADIMTPRINIEALDITADKETLISKMKEDKRSRYPVYVHSLDNIVGVIHSKDFLLNTEAPVKSLVKHPVFVPESMRIDDLLQDLQRKRSHIAIVTDEYGITSGVVTIEDVLEEIVGEIRDELDFETPKIKKIDKNSYEVEGSTHIDDVNEEIDISIETDEVDTIGGYAVLKFGKIPQAGDSVEVNGFLLKINDVSKNRVTSLTIIKTQEDKET